MRAYLRLVMVAWCVVLTCAPARAQQRGLITGKVVDTTGAVLPGVTITVTEQNTGFNRTLVSAETGTFAAPNLDPGVYRLTVELPGFATLKRDLTLTAGSEITLEFKMQVAAVQEAIQVTAEAPLIEKTSNRIGGAL